MDMLTDYAASHQHPFNVCVHAIGIPTIMLGVLIPLTWASVEISGITINLAHIAMLGFFAFYMTLDKQFAIAAHCGALPETGVNLPRSNAVIVAQRESVYSDHR